MEIVGKFSINSDVTVSLTICGDMFPPINDIIREPLEESHSLEPLIV